MALGWSERSAIYKILGEDFKRAKDSLLNIADSHVDLVLKFPKSPHFPPPKDIANQQTMDYASDADHGACNGDEKSRPSRWDPPHTNEECNEEQGREDEVYGSPIHVPLLP